MSRRSVRVDPTAATDRRRSSTSAGTVAALPACTVACNESGRFCRSRYHRRRPGARRRRRCPAPRGPGPRRRARWPAGRPAPRAPSIASTPAAQLERRVVRHPRQLHVARVPQMHHHRPRGGDRPRRPGARHRGRRVEAPEPVLRDEELLAGQLVVPIQDHRHALGRVPVLVHVRRHGRDPGHPEVELPRVDAGPVRAGTAAGSHPCRRRRGRGCPAAAPAPRCRRPGRSPPAGTSAPTPTTKMVSSVHASSRAAARPGSQRPPGPGPGRRRSSRPPW